MRITQTFSLSVLFAISLVAGCEPAAQHDARTNPEKRPHPIQVGKARTIETDRAFSLTGVARAADRASLAFQVSGRLAERPVSIGQAVDRGELIGRLQQPELEPAAEAARAQRKQLRTQLAQAERDLERVQKLHAAGAATQQELESARSRRDSLSASLQRAGAEFERAERLLSETRLTAPVAGTVEQVFFQPGEFVPAGQPVVALSGSGALEAEIGLPETLLDEVRVGDEARLTLPLLDERQVTGRVTELADSSPGQGRLFPAVVTMQRAEGLRAGVTVAWHLESDQSSALSVPVNAIASLGGRGQTEVFTVVDGVARSVPIKLGAVIGERAVVEGDLAPGATVVTLGLEGLVDSRKVEVRQ